MRKNSLSAYISAAVAAVFTFFTAAVAHASEGHDKIDTLAPFNQAGEGHDYVAIAIVMVVLLALVLGLATLVSSLFAEEK